MVYVDALAVWRILQIDQQPTNFGVITMTIAELEARIATLENELLIANESLRDTVAALRAISETANQSLYQEV